MAEVASEILHSVEKLHPQDGDLYLIRVPDDFSVNEASDISQWIYDDIAKKMGIDFHVIFLIGGLEEPQLGLEKVDEDTMRKLGWMRIPKEVPIDPLNFVTSEGACYHDFGKGACPVEGCVHYGGVEVTKRSEAVVKDVISKLKKIGALD